MVDFLFCIWTALVTINLIGPNDEENIGDGSGSTTIKPSMEPNYNMEDEGTEPGSVTDDLSEYLVALILLCIGCICIAGLMLCWLGIKKRRDKQKQKDIMYSDNKSMEMVEKDKQTNTESNRDGEAVAITTDAKVDVKRVSEKRVKRKVRAKTISISTDKYVYNPNHQPQNMGHVQAMRYNHPQHNKLVNINSMSPSAEQYYQQQNVAGMGYNLPINNLMNINSNSSTIPMSMSHNINNIHLQNLNGNVRTDVNMDNDYNMRHIHHHIYNNQHGNHNKTNGYIHESSSDEDIINIHPGITNDRIRKVTVTGYGNDEDNGTGTGTTSGEGTTDNTGTSDEGTKEISSHPTNSSNYNNDDTRVELQYGTAYQNKQEYLTGDNNIVLPMSGGTNYHGHHVALPMSGTDGTTHGNVINGNTSGAM